MVELSLRFERLALLGSLGLLLWAYPARAQLPAHTLAPAPEPPPSTPAPAPAEPTPSAPGEADAALPPAPEAPPGASAPPAPTTPPAAAPGQASPGQASPAPARAAMLTDCADAPPELPADDDETGELAPRRKWYGWQTLTTDGASLAVLLIGAAGANVGGSRGDGSSNLAAAGVLGYVFAPGIVHFTHRNPGRGFASFGMRIGFPIAGAMLGAAMGSGCNEYLCEAQGAAIGALLGVGGAIAIDAAVFAYDDRKPSPPSLGGLSPLVLIGKNRALLGVGGAL